MYQRLAALVAEKLRRQEAAVKSQAKRDQPSLATPAEASITKVADIVAETFLNGSQTPTQTNRLASLSPSFDTPGLRTPASQRSGGSISRSSSSASLSRASSTASLGDGESQIQIDVDDFLDDEDCTDASADSNDDDDDEEENQGGYDGIKNKRGHKIVYTCEDRTEVTVPILTFLDSRFLAPVQSVLYPQGQKNRNGEFKKYAPLDFDCFKNMIKGIIRELAADNDGPQIYQRLFWAAYDVARKRRANHLQSWRLHGYPKDLIYGGKREFIEKHGDPWAKNKCKRKRKRRRRKKYSTTSQRRRKRKGAKKLNFEEGDKWQQQLREPKAIS